MKKQLVFVVLVVLLFSHGALPVLAQKLSAQVEGTVTEAGKPLANVAVVLTNTGTGRTFKSKTDMNGKFSVVGVPYGDYEVEITSPSGEKLFKRKTSVAPSEASAASTMKIDVSETKSGTSQSQSEQAGSEKSGQQAPKYTPEQTEAIKKQNEKATSMNALIQQAQNAMNAKDWQGAISPLQELLALDPTRWQFYSALGDAQLNLGQYDRAVESYEKGIHAAESNATVDARDPSTDPAKKKAGVAKMLTNEGNAYLKLHKTNEAVALYMKAAAMDPNPAIAYFNLCATQYNVGNFDGALAACDKAIAADPNKADAYFIKGSALYGNGKLDAANKYVVPPGTVEALNKYLALAPDGAHSADVRAMLEAIGVKVETTYEPKKK
jgi:Flp pilus assembly protein TadD